MKKTKLLTSVAALALVLSLGACNQPEDDSTGSEETSSETSSSSSSTSTEQEKVTLTNYTLSITLKDEAGEPVVIPFYDSVYICGSWDSWAEWTVLTDIGDETESVLTTTFASIEEGTYNFKGVVGGQEETPSWNLTELIVSSTGGDVSFEVNAEDGDNYTNNLEFTVDATKVPVLEETPMTEEEIITAILAAAEDADDNGLGWVAFHGEALDESTDDLTEAYLTTDANGDPYGYVYEYDTDDEVVLFEYYYVDGNEYFHRLSGDYYSVDEAEDSFEDMLEDYIEGLTPFAYASYGDREDWVLGHEDESSIYTLTIPDTYVETLTVRRAGDDFEIIAVEESTENELTGVESTKGELITAADVEAQMGGFNADYWDPLYFGGATDPSELVYRAALTGNYSVEIEYDYYESSSTITYAEYELAIEAMYGNTSEEALAALAKYYALEDDMTLAEKEIIDLYYDRDYIYAEHYEIIDGTKYRTMIEVVINAEDGPWDYWTTDGSSWHYYSPTSFASVGASSWEDYYGSLFDAYDEGTADHLVYDETYDAYDFDDWTYNWYYGYVSQASADWFVDLGGDMLMGVGYAWTYAYYYYLHYYTFFDEDDQVLTSWYEYAYLYYADEQSTDLFLGEEDIYMTVYDVGETDKRETVEYYHNGLQASINGSN